MAGLALSAVYGAVLLWSDLTDPDQKKSARLTRFMAAVVNVFIIFGAASSAVSGVNAATAPPAAGSRPASLDDQGMKARRRRRRG
jgi:hypothetical protein